MGFMEGLLDVLSGPMAVKQINENGFDFREKRQQEELARQQKQQEWNQANEKYAMQIGEDAVAGAQEGETPDLSSLFPNADQSRRKLMIDALVGRGRERKSAIEAQKAATAASLLEKRGQQGLELVGARGAESRKTNEAKQDWEDTRPASPRDQANWNAAMERVMAAIAGRDSGQKGGRWAWNTQTNSAEWVTPEMLSTAPKGLYTDPTSGRQGAATQSQREGMDKIVSNLESSLSDYEATQQGLGRVVPSVLSPAKAVAWNRYKNSLQSAGQAFGRKVLNDTRVSNEDRIAYANTIGQTSELMTALDPKEARRRAAQFFDAVQDYDTKYGGGVAAPAGSGQGGGGGETMTYGGVTYRLKPGADRKLKSSWEPVR